MKINYILVLATIFSINISVCMFEFPEETPYDPCGEYLTKSRLEELAEIKKFYKNVGEVTKHEIEKEIIYEAMNKGEVKTTKWLCKREKRTNNVNCLEIDLIQQVLIMG